MKETRRKYQVFLSSTFSDLIEERNVAIDAIMQLRQIPSGMELFGAMGEEQFAYIKEVIKESDYYLLIIGGKYGSLGPDGKSYTEAEYDYAVSRGLRIIAFIHECPEERPAKFYEQDEDKREKLERFKQKVMESRLVSFWRDLSDLRLKILSSLSNVINEFPAKGWVKEIGDEREESLLFPWLKEEGEGERIHVTYDYSDPSKAVVRSDTSYVQLSVRDGRIEDWMVKACEEYINLLNFNRKFFRRDEMICLRRMWFNTVSPEVIVSMDLLYDIGATCSWDRRQIKEMFYGGEVLGDGICYEVLVRMKQAIFCSDHFDENHADYYLETDPRVVSGITIDWSQCRFEEPVDYEGATRISCSLKLTNQERNQMEFGMEGEFEVVDEELNYEGSHSYIYMDCYQEPGGSGRFALKAHETKRFSCVFKNTFVHTLKQKEPLEIHFINQDVDESDEFL